MDEQPNGVLGEAPAQRDAEARRLRASLDRALFDTHTEVALDRYRLGDVLGRGGVGVVYRAFDPLLERDVALKVLRIEGSDVDGPPRAKERLLREARAMAALSHPDIVPIYDVGSVDEEVYIAMELVEGGTLRTWLQTARTTDAILAAFAAAGRGLGAAHAAGLVHRDFKPDNVLVGPGEQIRVSDFGLVRATASTVTSERDEAESPVQPDTITRGSVGTPGYIAPEQRRGDPVDPRADQFSFCVALCEALAGERPRDADAADALLSRVSPQRRAAIVRGLAADPRDRWPDLHGLLAALSPPRRSPSLWLGGGAVVITAAVVLAFGEPPPLPAPQTACSVPDSPWTKTQRRTLAEHFGRFGTRYASEVWPRVDGALQRRAQVLAEAWDAACAAAADDPEALPPRAQCLQRAGDSMATLLTTLADADEAAADKAVISAMRLPDPRECERDADRPPTDVARWDATLAIVEEAGAAMDRAQYAQALERSETALAEATAIDAADLVFRARFRRAEAMWRLGRTDEAAAEWSQAALQAEAS